MEIVKGGVTAAKGFEAASTAAGIKYKDRTDMALVYSQVPCVSAGTFTKNVVKAAPVKWVTSSDRSAIIGAHLCHRASCNRICCIIQYRSFQRWYRCHRYDHEKVHQHRYWQRINDYRFLDHTCRMLRI